MLAHGFKIGQRSPKIEISDFWCFAEHDVELSDFDTALLKKTPPST